jgi:hypothetical protein
VQGNNNVLLTWGTITEINTQNFIVQHSADNGKTWININTQPTKAANGNSSTPLRYTFTDANVQPGSYEYRVMETDINGNTQISNVVQIEISGGIKIFPNPANALINVALPSGAINVSYRLISLEGKVVQEGTMQGNYGQIPVSSVAAGIYFLQIIFNNTAQTYKVQIQH